MLFSVTNTLLSVLACSLVCFPPTQGEPMESYIRKYVIEGEDVILPCSRNSVEISVVYWRNTNGKYVFIYERGVYVLDSSWHDEQYRGRASLFYDELKNGNASMILGDTRTEDTGNYTCVLPNLSPGGQRSTVELIVRIVLEPYLGIYKETEDRVELQCVVRGSSSKLSLEWQTCEGTVLNAKKLLVSKTGRHYDTKLFVNVTKTASTCFRCVVKQTDIYHMIDRNITLSGKVFEKKYLWTVVLPTAAIIVLVTALLMCCVWVLYLIKRRSQNDLKSVPSDSSSGHYVINMNTDTQNTMNETDESMSTRSSSDNNSCLTSDDTGETDSGIVILPRTESYNDLMSYKKSRQGSSLSGSEKFFF